MTQIILIIISIAIVILLLHRRSRESIVGICAVALDQTIRKNANKEKILKLLTNKEMVSNSDIREALGIASRTVVRYMDELEKEDKVEQVGTIGHQVTYRLK
ncbi:MAG: winged helix-turn-helix transcriptional regulator [Candidatus Colwellbacteria bacterium]|nr:winged helix-turn-helix transcriptional regulator [Candidatus Colwellbacteria bacterium]